MIMRDETVFKFKECGLVLHYYDMARNDDKNSAKNNSTITPYPLLSTLTEGKRNYMRADIEGADRERRYQ